MRLCSLAVYWHFLSDLGDFPLSCLSLSLCGLPELSPSLSITARLFAVAYTTLVLMLHLCFSELPTFFLSESYTLWHPMTYSMLSAMLSAFPFSLSGAVCKRVPPSPFVSSLRPFYPGCFYLLVFSCLCSNLWTSGPGVWHLYVQLSIRCLRALHSDISLTFQVAPINVRSLFYFCQVSLFPEWILSLSEVL